MFIVQVEIEWASTGTGKMNRTAVEFSGESGEAITVRCCMCGHVRGFLPINHLLNGF